jgi:hypothetical protein
MLNVGTGTSLAQRDCSIKYRLQRNGNANENYQREKSSMNEILMKQIGSLSPGQAGWHNHVSNCIAAEMCPDCGNDIFVNEELIDRQLGKITFFECSTCEWKNYDYVEHRL